MRRRSDRNEGWMKIRTLQTGKFPVIGFVKDRTGVAALHLGKRETRSRLHGKGRDRMVADRVELDQKTA